MRNGDHLRIVEREPDDRAHLLVIDAVDDRDHRNDLDACVVQVVDRLQLHVEQIADQAVRVGCVADAVELQVRVTQPGVGGLLAELGALRELDSVGGRLHAVVADFHAHSEPRPGSTAKASARRRRTAPTSGGAA